ncbi:MAG TPA: hypothetical protein VFW20_08720 [Candidatus Limnocylindrales bacterium]|nr:hypothetical protein [Candidatus Limnocylindrales bacterium]
MRALAVAQAWIAAGGSVSWLAADAPDALASRATAAGASVERLDVASPGSPEDADVLAERMVSRPTARAIVDGLQFDDGYLSRLEPVASRVLLVDDMAMLASYPVGWVLNQNAHAARASYPAASPARFLLGLRYVALRPEFWPAPPERSFPPIARKVLVTFGGADPTSMALRTVDDLRALPPSVRRDVHVRVLVGAASTDAPTLHARTRSAMVDLGYRLEVGSATSEMPAEMAWADLAIVSGGTTVWELARMGTPALVIETVPPELDLVRGLHRVGLFESLGWHADLLPGTMATAVSRTMTDLEWRRRMSGLGRSLVDGQGARRVVTALSSIGGTAGEVE